MALSPGAPARAFALHDNPHSRITLEDFPGQAIVLAFYVADWHPVATAQLAVHQQLLPHLRRVAATVLGVSVDGPWSHHEFARTNGIEYPLLSDDTPPGEVARAYGVYSPVTGRSRRALFVIDPTGIIRWSETFPDAVNPGADGMLSALESLRPTPVSDRGPETLDRTGTAPSMCPCGCGLSAALVVKCN